MILDISFLRLLVIGFIILVILLGLALYFVFFKPPVEEIPITEYAPGEVPGIGEGEAMVVEEIIEKELPWQDYFGDKISTIANGGLTAVTKLTDSTVKGFNGSQYYDTETQQFYRINDQGIPELLTEKKFYEVDEVSWTKRGDKAILVYPDGSNILYNFNTAPLGTNQYIANHIIIFTAHKTLGLPKFTERILKIKDAKKFLIVDEVHNISAES